MPPRTPPPASHTREGVRVMIAAIGALGRGRAAELGAEDDQRVVQQASRLQIAQQPGDGRSTFLAFDEWLLRRSPCASQ